MEFPGDSCYVPFPWENLITAVSTLTAAVGGVTATALFTGRNDERKLAHERLMGRLNRRADCYSRFLQVAHTDARGLSVTFTRLTDPERTISPTESLDELRRLIIIFNEGLALVEILGSETAVRAARQVSEAARDLGRVCVNLSTSQPPPEDVVTKFDTEHRELRRLIESFADVCRLELEGDHYTA